MSLLNPFIWDRPLEDPTQIVGMDEFARKVALILKGRTNVALFGARGTGKSTFLTQLTRELEESHGTSAPAHIVVRINLERAFSIPAFIACVHDAMVHHPQKNVRRAATKQIETLEREVGFDIKVIKGTERRGYQTSTQDAQTLHAQLSTLAALGKHVVVVFDEFQRLNRCPEEPLAIIRSALMTTATDHVSLMLTGSIRETMEMMLKHSTEPIFNQATHIELPPIGRTVFLEYIENNFEATDHPISEAALEYLLSTTKSHPKRTQQLAWETWQIFKDDQLDVEEVKNAYQRLMTNSQADFAVIENTLASGSESDENERRALYLVANYGGKGVTNRRLAHLFGLGAHTTARDALERLSRRGLVTRNDQEWKIIDPFLEDWLRINSPLTLRPQDVTEWP